MPNLLDSSERDVIKVLGSIQVPVLRLEALRPLMTRLMETLGSKFARGAMSGDSMLDLLNETQARLNEIDHAVKALGGPRDDRNPFEALEEAAELAREKAELFFVLAIIQETMHTVMLGAVEPPAHDQGKVS